jgi:alkylation response protein AidB-like acyl-CoA dehydrogenase
MAQAEQSLCATAIDILGDGHGGDFWRERYLYSRAATVYGGTQQIQRDIIANRVLSLPQD